MHIYYIYIFLTFLLYGLIQSVYLNNVSDVGAKHNEGKLYFVLISGVLLFLILALRRVDVGTDTISYFYKYREDNLPDWRLGVVPGNELGFAYLIHICNQLGFSWQEFNAITAAIIVYPICKFFYRYSANTWGSFLLYITVGLFTMNLSGLRQSLAVSMVLMATMALFDKRYIGFVLYLILGYSFHTSAIFSLLLLFVPFIKYKRTRQLYVLLLLPLVARLLGDYGFSDIVSYLPKRYGHFLDEEGAMNPILETMRISFLVFCFIVLRVKKNITDLDFKLYILVSFYLTGIELSHSVYMASRLAYFFEMAVAVAIPNYINKLSGKINRQIMAAVIYILCLAAFIVSSFGSDTLSFANYKFFWE